MFGERRLIDNASEFHGACVSAVEKVLTQSGLKITLSPSTRHTVRRLPGAIGWSLWERFSERAVPSRSPHIFLPEAEPPAYSFRPNTRQPLWGRLSPGKSTNAQAESFFSRMPLFRRLRLTDGVG